MNEIESMERFTEGLKKAASRCRELGKLQQSNGWDALTASFEGLLRNGQKLYSSSVMSRHDALKMLDEQYGKTIN